MGFIHSKINVSTVWSLFKRFKKKLSILQFPGLRGGSSKPVNLDLSQDDYEGKSPSSDIPFATKVAPNYSWDDLDPILSSDKKEQLKKI